MNQKEIEDRHIEHLIKELEGLSIEEKLDRLEKDDFEFKYYQSSRYTNCPEPIKDIYFKDWNENPEWSYWVMKKYARFLLDLEKENPKNVQRFNSKIAESLIKAEIATIEEEAKESIRLFETKEFDIYNWHKNNTFYHPEIETVKVLMGNYYQENYLHTPWGSTAGLKYFRHYLWKEYLEGLVETNSTSNDTYSDYFDGLSINGVALLCRYLGFTNLNSARAEKLLENVEGINSYTKVASAFRGFKDESSRVNHASSSGRSVSEHRDRFLSVINKLEKIGNKKGLELAQKEFKLFEIKNS